MGNEQGERSTVEYEPNGHLLDLERNLRAAIDALHSERFYEFTDGLLRLLEHAKHDNRLLWSILSGAAGDPREGIEEHLAAATEAKTWW